MPCTLLVVTGLLTVLLALAPEAAAQVPPLPPPPPCGPDDPVPCFQPPPPPMFPADPRRDGAIFVQCPGDTDGDAVPDAFNLDTNGDGTMDAFDPDVRCVHLAAGDGKVTMADGRPLYIFSFADVTSTTPLGTAPWDRTTPRPSPACTLDEPRRCFPHEVMEVGMLAANAAAPTLRLKEGQHFYLNLSNVGMVLRPDLSDPHSVHFHGFPQAAPVFDGTPETSISVNMGATITYFYQLVEPGTYLYHCHVEASEHMQMGMLGNLYVEPRQNRTGCPGGACPIARLEGGASSAPLGYVYNDADGSTAYDVEKEIQISSFDPDFHDASELVQPLPFAAMDDRYPLLNGRGYPDTINPAVISTDTDLGPKPSQPIHSLITATAGQRLLLRISSLSTTRFYTLASTLPMRAVGHNARLLRGPDPDGPGPLTGRDLSYITNSVTLGGGESIDVILDIPAGAAGTTQLLYTTNLHHLSNDGEDFGGLMTEIRIQ